MIDDNKTCVTCRFWDADLADADDRSREALSELDDMKVPCRRHAPAARVVPDIQGGALIDDEVPCVSWAETYATDWCGDWEGLGDDND